MVLDLGGVVFSIDWKGPARHLGPTNSELENFLIHSLGTWETYDRFERGGLSEAHFHEAFAKRAGLDFDFATFEKGWNSLILGVIPGVEEVLKKVAKQVPLYALSNTNPTHYRHVMRDFPEMRHFKRVFASCEMGHRKPEERIYAELCREINVPPSGVLFVDDLEANIASAKKFGMQAERVLNSAEQLAKVLKIHP